MFAGVAGLVVVGVVGFGVFSSFTFTVGWCFGVVWLVRASAGACFCYDASW